MKLSTHNRADFDTAREDVAELRAVEDMVRREMEDASDEFEHTARSIRTFESMMLQAKEAMSKGRRDMLRCKERRKDIMERLRPE